MVYPNERPASSDEDARGRSYPSFNDISTPSYSPVSYPQYPQYPRGGPPQWSYSTLPHAASNRTSGLQQHLESSSPRVTSRPQEPARVADLSPKEWTTLDEQNAVAHGHPPRAPQDWKCPLGFHCEPRERFTPGVGVQRSFVPGRGLRLPSPNPIPEKCRQDVDYEVPLTAEGARVLEEKKRSERKHLAAQRMEESRQSEARSQEKREEEPRKVDSLRMSFRHAQQVWNMRGLQEPSDGIRDPIED